VADNRACGLKATVMISIALFFSPAHQVALLRAENLLIL
jgi:hypothetical protein